MGQILVKVRDISVDDNQKPTLTNGNETIITYKAYEYTRYRYELLYQCDQNGKQIAGNPNLNAQDKSQALQQRSVELAGNTGPSQSEIDLQDEVNRLRKQLEQAQKAQVTAAPVVEAVTKKDEPEEPVITPEEPQRKRQRKPQTQAA